MRKAEGMWEGGSQGRGGDKISCYFCLVVDGGNPRYLWELAENIRDFGPRVGCLKWS